MPTLDWLDRDAAFRVADAVPTRVLRPHAAGHRFGDDAGAAGGGNLLIQGDNLEALRALLPFYRGRVKALVQRLALRIAELRDKTAKTAFTQLVPDGGWDLHVAPSHAFRFDPAVYPVPANRRYAGKIRFAKHFYPVVANLKDGGEEHACAVAIDAHAKVKHWVRNLDSDPVAGFWLPTSAGRFYPDFVCELADGRVFVAEYKGEHLRTVPKEIEKSQVGRVWAAVSGGKAVFATLFKQERGMNLAQQIDEALK